MKARPPDINEVLKLKNIFGPGKPLAVIPLLVAKKIPAQAWKSAFEDGPWSDDELRSIWRERGRELNPGLACGPLSGPGLIVVDGDNAEALIWMRANLPPTPMRTITRNGEHWYYADDGATGVGNRSDVLGSKKRFEYDAGKAGFDVRLHPKPDPEEQAAEKARAAQARKDAVAAGVTMAGVIDIRGRGGQVVLPGAIHPSGFVYAQAEPWHAQMKLPKFDPDWFEGVKWRRPETSMLDSGMTPMALMAARQREKWLTEARENTTADEKLRRARAYLATIEGAVGGAGGHDKLFYAACRLVKGFLIPAEDALSLLLSDYNSRCSPEWTYDEVAHKVDDAVKQLGADDGHMLVDTPEWVASQKFWANNEYVAGAEPDGPSGDGYEGVSDAELAGVEGENTQPPAVENAQPPALPHTQPASPRPSLPPADSEDVRQWRRLWADKGVNYDDIGQDWDRKKDGTGKRWTLPPTTNNLVVMLKHRREFAVRNLAYNEKDMQKEIDGREYRDSDDLVLHGRLGLLWNDEIVRERSRDAVSRVCFDNTYDPWTQFAASLPAWDGHDYLGDFVTDVLGFDASIVPDAWQQAYTEWRHQLTGVMARGLVPGTKVHTILILVGGQGRLKSTLLRELVNGRDRAWDFFTDQGFRLDNKDGQMLIGAYHVCEWGESEHAKNPKAIDIIKAFLAQETDVFRNPYGRHLVRRPRRVVFFGTSNEAAGLLHDTTGHRRFYICNIGANVLNLNTLHDIRLQLWAQILDLRNRHLAAAPLASSDPAAAAEFNATRWWYEADEEAARASGLGQYVAENQYHEHIEVWLATREEPFRIMDVIESVLQVYPGQVDMRMRREVTTALTRLGATRLKDGACIRVGGRVGRYWKPPTGPVEEAI